MRRRRGREDLAGREADTLQRRILADGHAAIASVRRRQQRGTRRQGNFTLFITRRCAGTRRADPDLQQVRGDFGRGIELAVPDTEACAHALHLAGTDDGAVAEAVTMLERAGENHRHDLHVAVTVHRKALAGRDDILVDDAQRSPAHLGGIEIIGKGEAVPAFQPAVVGMTAVLGRAECYHGSNFLTFFARI